MPSRSAAFNGASPAYRQDDIPIAPAFDWRKLLPVHPAADAFPPIPHDGLITIGEDIKVNGLRLPIIVQREFDCRPGNASFSVLDGRSRLDAMVAVGIEFEIAHTDRYEGPTIETQEDGPIVDIQVVELPPPKIAAFVLSVNLHRRHLDAEGKRAAIDALLKLDPGKSDRQIAEQTGSSPTTVGKQREKAESAGDVSRMDTHTDTKGREQPAKKPPKKIAKSAPSDTLVTGAEKPAPAAATRSGVSPKDTGLAEFDALVLRLLQKTRKAKPARFAKTGVNTGDLKQLSDFLAKVFLAKVAVVMKDTTSPAPQAAEEKTPTEEEPPPPPPPPPKTKTKRSLTQSRDPLEVKWRHLNANDLEAAITDGQRYGDQQSLKQIDRMKKRLARLRAAERTAEAATRH
jgi:hypothetical protein